MAIVGAGGTGTCSALELASRGHRVDLFEQHAQAVSQASFVNEGKIHLGFIYARDARLRTARVMVEGALHFARNLRRWIPLRAGDLLSTPFHYCAHRGSLSDPEALARHYDACAALYRERARATGLDYLDLGEGCRVARLKRDEYAELVDPDHFTAVFRTSERAIDPRAVAEALRAALAVEPRIRFRPRRRVTRIREDRRGGYRLRFVADGREREDRYDDVVNATWYQRLPFDREMGIRPPRGWSHRYKFGNRVHLRLEPSQLPSCTIVQGPFGDIVNFGGRGLFLSWYPIGRTGMSSDEVPPDWHGAYSPDQRHAVFRRSLAELSRRCAALAALPIPRERVDPAGGVIYALGTTDVDDRKSDLHARFDIGIQTRGRYHSVDTGKYTLVPWWGVRVADRVEGRA